MDIDMETKASLVFMAAGFGTRFGGGVKQIEPIGPNGEVLMDYAVHDALAAGFNRIIFIIRRDIEDQFRSGVGRRVEKKCDVHYVYQETDDLPAGFERFGDRKKPWGTGQAVLACRKIIREPFCVLNADDYYGAQAFRGIYSHLSRLNPYSNALDLCMAGYVLGNTLSESGAVTRGICQVRTNGRLLGIRETRGIITRDGEPWVEVNGEMRSLDSETTVSMNIWGMPAAFIDYLQEEFVPFLRELGDDYQSREFLLPSIIGRMIQLKRGSVQVLPTDDRWFGMTYAADKKLTQERIRELIAAGVYPEKM